jgi:hypothetical protein
MNAHEIAERISRKRWCKPAWALEFEADAFNDTRDMLLAQIADAGTTALEDTKPQLRPLYRQVKSADYQTAVIACVEAAIVITWDMRRRGGDHNSICTFVSFRTEPGDVADMEFEFGYLTVRKAYY